ncbi:MAG: DUF1080 domain-containing protein [Verrucomicrobia bacterium]|nr:MAG: DUF1080 domain-containing protein [Verrucomicrobiota bacterium]
MPPLPCRIACLFALSAAVTCADDSTVAPNTLSAPEQAAGWRLLWDGKTDSGWRSVGGEAFPKSGWTIQDGELSVAPAKGGPAPAGGDIVTREKFSDFELVVDFKITAGANSGIKLFIDPSPAKGADPSLGPEFQILDDAKHPDAKLGRNGNRTLGSLYDLIPAAADKTVNPIGEWNHARILSQGPHVEFWLNGRKTVEFERASPAWRETVATSKFKGVAAFGELTQGHILLQDHGNPVSFRNLKIRVPAAP